MKWKIVRFKDHNGLPSLALVDENGKLIPGQRDIVFSSPFERPEPNGGVRCPEVTVTFAVDGKHIGMDFDLECEWGGAPVDLSPKVVETRSGTAVLYPLRKALEDNTDGFTETFLRSLEKQQKEEPN